MLDPEVLGRILVMQSMISNLPDEKAVFRFLCRGLEDIPGVVAVCFGSDAEESCLGMVHKTIAMGDRTFGVLEFQVAMADQFEPYEPYIDNLCFMVAVILEERWQREVNQQQRAQLEAQTESLRKSLADLESAQIKIIETEKLAVLGQLTATIAHELNTPLGAIRSSASYLHQSPLGHSQPFFRFLRGLSDRDFGWFCQLTSRIGLENLSSPNTERPRRRALAKQLEKLGVEECDDLAEIICLLATPEEQHGLVEAATDGRVELLRQAARIVEVVRAGSIILQAADRAAATVTALVDYSRREESTEHRPVDPAREFETLLQLYFGASRHEVTFQREFEPGLVIYGDRDRLNQVWSNLINNALQAMEYRGRIILRTARVSGGVEISVSNDGPGIAPDLGEKIFQPFFTTKPAGQGTGLGLDICRRIVKAHGGTLRHKEDPPWTIFLVHLPAGPE